MPFLPEGIIVVLTPFAGRFSRPDWAPAQVVRVEALLCRGPRTVAAVLRRMGLGQEKRCEQSYRVRSRARWSGRHGGTILLGLLVSLLPAPWPGMEGWMRPWYDDRAGRVPPQAAIAMRRARPQNGW